MLRLTYNYKQKYYKLNLNLTPKEWESVTGEKPRGINKSIKLKLAQREARATEIINNLPIFSFPLFELQFSKQDHPSDTVFNYFEKEVNMMREQGRVSTASSYECCNNSLRLFIGKKKTLTFEEITPEFLTKYEHWMKNTEIRGKGKGS